MIADSLEGMLLVTIGSRSIFMQKEGSEEGVGVEAFEIEELTRIW